MNANVPQAQTKVAMTTRQRVRMLRQSAADAHRVLDEHAVVGAQQLGNQELEELLLHAARINALLADEVHPQRLEQVLWPLACDLIQRVLRSDTPSCMTSDSLMRDR